MTDGLYYIYNQQLEDFMSNEINIKIDISDELLGKLMTVMLASNSPMPMIGAMMPPPKEVAKKPPMGFQAREKKCK